MARGARRSAWTAAACASVVLGLCAWARGTLDAPWIAASVAALALGGFVGGLFRTRIRAAPEASAHARHSVAEALLANIPDPVILVDRRAVVIEVNPAARALLPALKLRHPLSFALRAPDVLDGIEEVLRTGAPLKTLYATRVPTERAFEVQIGALPMPDGPAGGQPNVVLFLRDLTSARRLEAMRVDFVANASHELRTPLASLLGFIETLQGPARNDAPARERFLAIMKTQAHRMTRLIDDLLSLSRIELREHVPPTKPVDLARIAREMVETQSPLARERGVEVTFEADGVHPMPGERDELLRVVENLVENAVKYGGRGGRVAVSVARLVELPPRRARIVLAVRDEGPGIAPEHIPRLTERFYRVDVASSRDQGGTGLGLAIVKHIVNRHRGRLVIESAPGAGTTVRVSFPEFVMEPGNAAETAGR
ncbi:PAS domain-containing sensor histidine kinase [Methylobacterium sp. Leaf469]|uniref:ATP-binding protein n=1 Tax=unclassified Methylobacterium TaxID=2615210 RepID=UPI0006FC3B36|nr:MULTISPECIES: ATP-binding protein [unclassified Methylobacterium]KQP36515.1 PAS domain-containing sensor histidine kinase [Methylobacterium sp. Leaf100]KQU05241.1 PAS domain-containing sensor histidine kinase [Methylobacterium sp. Leaf469]